jgi:hypothetical protein
MSERKEKQKRRAARQLSGRGDTSPVGQQLSLLDLLEEWEQASRSSSPPPPGKDPFDLWSAPEPLHEFSFLAMAIEPAVVLYTLEFYEQGGPAAWEVEGARAFGRLLAKVGHAKLLYRSDKKGETAWLFDGLAKALAILAHAQGGVPAFGKRYDVVRILTGFVGKEAAEDYWRTAIRRYYREVVTTVEAYCQYPPLTDLLGPFNLIHWFEKAPDTDLLQVRKEGYSNLSSGGNGLISKASVATQVLEQVVKEAELVVQQHENLPYDKEVKPDTRLFAHAQKIVQIRADGGDLACLINQEQAEGWLHVFRHTLVTGEPWIAEITP